MKDNNGMESISKVLVVALIGIMIGSGFVGVMNGITMGKGNNRMSKVTDTSLVACWHFDENTGTIAYDSSGNNNDGTIYGANWTSGVSGSALSFDGVDDYAEVPASNSLNITNEITIEAWVKTAYPDGGIAEKLTYRLGVGGSRLRFNLYNGTHTRTHFSSTNVSDGSWHHVVGTFDGAEMNVFIDGKIAAASMSWDGGLIATMDGVRFGWSAIGEYLDGIIDEVRIYNRALNANEIQQHYEQYAGAGLPDLTLTSSDISFSNIQPNVDETIMVNATIHNTGGNISQTFSDGFEDDIIGTTPSKWEVVPGSSGDAIIVENPVHTGNRSCSINDDILICKEMSGNITGFTVWIKANQTDELSEIRTGHHVGGNSGVRIRFGTDGNIGYFNGTTLYTISTYSTDIWYKISVIQNVEEKIYNLWINDTLIDTNIAFFNSSANTYNFFTCDAGIWENHIPYGVHGTFYVDDVFVNYQPENVTVKFYDGNPSNGTLIGTDTIPSILSGGSALASINWTPTTAGTHTIYVVADPDSLIAESDETNNIAWKSIYVSGVGLPDLTLSSSDISFSNSNPVVNETIMINATIHNTGGNISRTFSDGFEDDTLGVKPAESNLTHGWHIAHNYDGEGTVEIVSSPVHSGSHSLSMTYDIVVVKTFSENAREFEFYVYKLDTTNNSHIEIRQGSYPPTYDELLHLSFRDDGYFKYMDKNDIVHAIQSYEANRWYKISIILNQTNFDLYVDDELKLNDIDFCHTNRSGDLRFLFDMGTTERWDGWPGAKGGTTYFDDVRVGYAAPSDVTVKFYNGSPSANDTLIGTDTIPSTSAGTSAIASLNWTPTTAGNHTIYVVVDPDNLIAESDETNNIAWKNIYVSGAGLPDLTLSSSDISFSNSNPVVNETITINATIHNIGNGTANNVTVAFYDGGPYEVAFDSSDAIIFSFGIYNGKLYSGSYGDPYEDQPGLGIIYVYNGTNWDVAYDTPEDCVKCFSVYNSKLYVGTQNCRENAQVYVYDGNTWSEIWSTSDHETWDFAVYNDKLYLGTGYPTGRVMVYDGSSWNTSFDSPGWHLQSLEVYKDRLYAGCSGGGMGAIYEFDGSYWNLSYDPPEDGFPDIVEYNDKLYACTWDGNIYVFDGFSWNISYSPSKGVYRLSVYEDKLYAGGDVGIIYVFDGNSWATAFDLPEECIYSLKEYESKLYIGTGDNGRMYVYPGGTLIDTDVISLIQAGSSGVASINWIPTTAGTHTIYVVVDPDNLIAESDETNNIAWKSITVQGVGNQLPVVNITYPTESQTVNGTITITGTAYDPDNSSSGLVACWHFDENTSTIAHDSSGNNNNGTIYNATWTTGVSGSALNFDGDYVDCGDISATESMTIEAWIKPVNSSGYIVSKYLSGSPTVGRSYVLIIHESILRGGIYRTGTGNPGEYTELDSNSIIPLNTFTHVVMTLDHKNCILSLYINGELDAWVNTSDTPSSTNTPVCIGAAVDYYKGIAGFFNGTIDEVHIYDRALSVSEIQQHYEGSSSGVEKVEIKIDSGSWQLATGNTTWSFAWDTTTVSNGWHTIYARVYDGIEYSKIKSVSVYVNNVVPNQPPSAYIDSISPNPATEGETVTFTGHGTDPDGSVVAYNWRSSIDGQLSTEASFSTSSLSVGTHTIYFKVQDNSGAWSSEVDTTLVIEPFVQPMLTVTVNANPTTVDSSGTVAIIVTVTDGTNAVTGAIINIASNYGGSFSSVTDNGDGTYTATFTAPSVTNQIICTVTATASKVDCNSGSGYVDVTVNPVVINQSPTADFTYSPNSPEVNGNIQFNDTSYDPDGAISARYWEFDDGNVSSDQNPVHAYSLPGTYMVRLTVTDNGGANSICTKEISVKSLTPNQQPVVAITYPSDGSVVWGTITITGAASDPDGAVEKVEVKIDDGSWQPATGTATWTYIWDTALYAGANHTISVRAYDGTDYSTVESVTVYVNIMPVANFIYHQGVAAINGEEVNVTLRVAGEKYRFVNLTVYEDGNKVGFVSVERVPGKPEENTTSILIDSSKLYTILLEYTAEKKGGNSVWVTVEYGGISNEIHYVFHDDETKELDLTHTIDEMLWATGFVKFDARSSYDSDGEIVDYSWDFGDGAYGYGMIVEHNYAPGNHTVSLTVRDDDGATGSVNKIVTIIDITGYCAGYKGDYYGVSLHCAADLIITNLTGAIIGYNTTSGKHENWIPNATMILSGEFEIYLIPKGPGDFEPGDFAVLGRAPGDFSFLVFDPGDFHPGDFNPGDFNPGDFSGRIYQINSDVTSGSLDEIKITADGDNLTIKADTDKFYSVLIKTQTQEFAVYDIPINRNSTHMLEITNWSALGTAGIPSVNLTVGDKVIQLWNNFNIADKFKPDLNVTLTLSNYDPKADENVSVYVTLRNIGEGPARNIKVRFLVDNVPYGEDYEIALLWRDGIENITFYCTAKEGVHKLSVFIDPEYTIPELNENNNEDSINIEVKGAGAVPIAPIASQAVAIVGGVVATTIVIASVLAGTEVGKYSFFSLFGPLFIKRKTAVLDQFTRGRIYEHIKLNPGAHYNSIRDSLELGNGTLSYHLTILEKEGYIKSETEGMYKRFYSAGRANSFDKAQLPLSDLQQDIVDLVKSSPGITQKEITVLTNKAHQVISYNIKVLTRLGVINERKEGLKKKLYLEEKYAE